jgi:hypothetical protein
MKCPEWHQLVSFQTLCVRMSMSCRDPPFVAVTMVSMWPLLLTGGIGMSMVSFVRYLATVNFQTWVNDSLHQISHTMPRKYKQEHTISFFHLCKLMDMIKYIDFKASWPSQNYTWRKPLVEGNVCTLTRFLWPIISTCRSIICPPPFEAKKQLGCNCACYDETFDIAQEWWNGKKLVHTPTIEAFLWLVLHTHLISVSQAPTHAQLDF